MRGHRADAAGVGFISIALPHGTNPVEEIIARRACRGRGREMAGVAGADVAKAGRCGHIFRIKGWQVRQRPIGMRQTTRAIGDWISY